MKNHLFYFFMIIGFLFISCNRDEKIIKQLESKNINNIISGAEMAGSSGNKKFVPMLLKNSADLRTSTSLLHYGVSVYKAKMDALKKIYQKDPPNEIVFNRIDSTIIEFYDELYRKEESHVIK